MKSNEKARWGGYKLRNRAGAANITLRGSVDQPQLDLLGQFPWGDSFQGNFANGDPRVFFRYIMIKSAQCWNVL